MNPQEITNLWNRIIAIENALGLKPGLNEKTRLDAGQDIRPPTIPQHPANQNIDNDGKISD